jgi:glycerol-3-phosphate cytidylyltransferase
MYLDKKEIAKKLNKSSDDVIIGYTCSTFDLLHAGHLVMLMEAKSLCDYLVVGLLVDPTKDRPESKNKPIQSVFERYIQIAACKYVDEVIPFETEKDIEDMILTINPDIRICGEEYENTDHTGKGLCKVHYNKRRHSFSTSELRERIENAKK